MPSSSTVSLIDSSMGFERPSFAKSIGDGFEFVKTTLERRISRRTKRVVCLIRSGEVDPLDAQLLHDQDHCLQLRVSLPRIYRSSLDEFWFCNLLADPSTWLFDRIPLIVWSGVNEVVSTRCPKALRSSSWAPTTDFKCPSLTGPSWLSSDSLNLQLSPPFAQWHQSTYRLTTITWTWTHTHWSSARSVVELTTDSVQHQHWSEQLLWLELQFDHVLAFFLVRQTWAGMDCRFASKGFIVLVVSCPTRSSLLPIAGEVPGSIPGFDRHVCLEWITFVKVFWTVLSTSGQHLQPIGPRRGSGTEDADVEHTNRLFILTTHRRL